MSYNAPSKGRGKADLVVPIRKEMAKADTSAKETPKETEKAVHLGRVQANPSGCAGRAGSLGTNGGSVLKMM